ncbi:MAG: hypothetical protein AAGB35_04025 [Pseudomonadota bacterium]
MMLKSIILFSSILFITGCLKTVPTVPEDYTGPKSSISDSVQYIDGGKADFFYVSHINGNKIKDSRSESLSASYGNGNNLTTRIMHNSVPVQKQIFTIVGRTTYAMPIREIIGKGYLVEGDIEFTPEESKGYRVTGLLSKDGSSVWIEDVSNGEIIVRKIEKIKAPN